MMGRWQGGVYAEMGGAIVEMDAWRGRMATWCSGVALKKYVLSGDIPSVWSPENKDAFNIMHVRHSKNC
jgi:hypothetical protein